MENSQNVEIIHTLLNKYWVKEEIKVKLENILKQMKMKTQHTKLMGCSKKKTNWQDYSDTYLY